jgi:thiol-disulfide isomerase/thioredoxin
MQMQMQMQIIGRRTLAFPTKKSGVGWLKSNQDWKRPMARTPSTMLPLGTVAPDFSLPDFAGQRHSLQDFGKSPALLVMFICNHCPFVKHVRAELARLGRDYQPDRLAIVAINPNDTTAYPDDNAENMAREARAAGYTFPYLLDETQAIAKAYRAACTPDFFLFDAAAPGSGDRRLVYRGQLDDSRPGNSVPVTGRDLRQAIDALLAGQPLPQQQQPSIGCNIKWKPENAPDYYGAAR